MEGTNGMIPFNPDFGVIDFMNEASFDQHFMDLIRGENQNEVYDHGSFDQHMTGSIVLGDHCLVGGQLFPPAPAIDSLFDFDTAANDHLHGADIEFPKDQGADIEFSIVGEEESSDRTTTTITTTSARKKNKSGSKVDRSRTIVFERKRRGRMKEKLYALRSLVPNITKMDKASIVGDAVLYVQELQMQVRKLKDEICRLESDIYKRRSDYQISSRFYPMIKKTFKMEVVEMEELGFYVRIECNRGKGVAGSLYKAMDSLTSFNVVTSNLAASPPNLYVFIFTFHIMERDIKMMISFANLKLWIASAFLDQGFEFEFETLPSP